MQYNAKYTRKIELTSRACEWYVNRVNGGLIQGTGSNVWSYHLSTKRETGGGPIGVQVSEILRIDNTAEFLESGKWQSVPKTALVIFENENFLSLKVQMIAAEVNFLGFYTLPQKMTNLSTNELKARDELTNRYLHEHNVVMNGWLSRIFDLAKKAGAYIRPVNLLKKHIEEKEVILEPEMEVMLLQAIESYNRSVDRVERYQAAVYNFENEIKERNCKFIGINNPPRF